MGKIDQTISKGMKIHDYVIDEYKIPRQNSVRNRKFVNGNQYTDDEKEYLIADGRIPFVYNQLRPRVQNLKGTEQQNRVSVVFRPQFDDFAEIAKVIEGLWYTHINQNKFEDELTKVFEDGLINDVGGFIECNIFVNEIGYKDYQFKACNPYSVFVDPESRQYDLSDAQYVVKEAWLTLEEIKAKYGNLKGELKKSTNWWDDLSTTIKEMIKSPGNDEYQSSYYDKNSDRYKLIELQERKQVKHVTARDSESGNYVSIIEDDYKGDIKDRYDYINTKPKTKIKITTFLPYYNRVLYEGYNKMEGCDMFNVFRFSSYDSNIKKSEDVSFISLLIDLQRDYNRTRSTYGFAILSSQIAHIFVSDLDTELKEQLEENGNKPGFVGMYRDHKSPPMKLQNSPIDPNIFNMMNDIINQMDQISSIGDTRFGRSENSRESGKLFQMKEEASMVTINPYFRNLSKTRLQCAEYFMKTLKYVYDEPNRLATVMDRQGKGTAELILNMEYGHTVLNNITEFKGYVVPDEGKYSATALQAEFEKLFAIVNMMGGQAELIHWESVLNKSGISNVEPFLEHIQAVLGQKQELEAQERALQEDQAVSQLVRDEEQALQGIN